MHERNVWRSWLPTAAICKGSAKKLRAVQRNLHLTRAESGSERPLLKNRHLVSAAAGFPRLFSPHLYVRGSVFGG